MEIPGGAALAATIVAALVVLALGANRLGMRYVRRFENRAPKVRFQAALILNTAVLLGTLGVVSAIMAAYGEFSLAVTAAAVVFMLVLGARGGGTVLLGPLPLLLLEHQFKPSKLRANRVLDRCSDRFEDPVWSDGLWRIDEPRLARVRRRLKTETGLDATALRAALDAAGVLDGAVVCRWLEPSSGVLRLAAVSQRDQSAPPACLLLELDEAAATLRIEVSNPNSKGAPVHPEEHLKDRASLNGLTLFNGVCDAVEQPTAGLEFQVSTNKSIGQPRWILVAALSILVAAAATGLVWMLMAFSTGVTVG